MVYRQWNLTHRNQTSILLKFPMPKLQAAMFEVWEINK